MSQTVRKPIFLTISIGCHILAMIQFAMAPPVHYFSHWDGQFNFLLIVSAVMTLTLAFYKNCSFVRWILFIQSFIFLYAGLPLGGYLGAKLTFFTAITINTFLYMQLKTGLSLAVFLLCASMALQLPVKAWGSEITKPSLHDLISYGFYGFLVITFNFSCRWQEMTHVPAEEHNRHLNEATVNLIQLNLQLQELAVTAETEAIFNERKRLAREIHDTLGHTLTNLIMMLEAATDLAVEKSESLIAHLQSARHQAFEGYNEVCQALHALKPMEKPEIAGFVKIQLLVETVRRITNMEIDLNLGNTLLSYGPEIDLTVYRLAQEGITNALRHGRADKIIISCTQSEEWLSILIRDNGVGTQKFNEGYGLTGMRERVEKLQGRLEITTSPGEGFTIIIWLSLRER